MNPRESQLSPRLALCASFVREGSIVADIGTDHALLPIWLVRKGKAVRAVASDINEGPIARARLNISRSGMEDRVSTVVADGLAGIDPAQVTDIIIAGMGGDLIAAILSAAPWVKDVKYRLILQPMSHPERLREYLLTEGFSMAREEAVRDSGRVYSVIHAEYTGRTEISDLLMYGGLLTGRKDEVSMDYLERTSSALRRKAAGMKAAGQESEAARFAAIADELLK